MTMRTSLVMAAGAVLMAVATLPAQGERPSGLHEVDTRRIPAMRREISLDLRGVTLDAALQEIASRANLSLTYSLEVLPKRRTVSLSAEKIEVEQALREVLRDSGLDVVALSSGQVVVVRDRLRNRQPAHVVGVITGRVTDRTSGQPVVAAQVSVTGTTLGRITGEDGRYMIPNVPAGPVQVQARRIGYESQTQSVTVADGATATLDFVLTEAVAQLEQVVTTVTGNQRRAEIGNAIARIDADSTVRSAPVRDLGDLVNGRAAGVQVFFPNGVVGQAPRFRIRGVNSFTVRNDPLVIVDGVRVENSPGTLGAANLVALVFPQNTGRLADLNPEEIETIDIVKGPSAATLYGTDAANGVVLVTTKRGRAGEAAWTVYTEQGVSDVRADWPTNYFGWGRNTVTGAVQQCMLLALAAGQCRQDSVTTFNPMLDAPNSPLGTGHRQSYGLQVSGGATQLRYFFSGEFEDETGYLRLPDVEQEFLRQSRGGAGILDEQIRPNALRKISLRGNASAALGSTADVSISAGFVRNDTRLPGFDVVTGAEQGSGTADTLTQWARGLRPGIAFAPVSTQEVTRFTGGVTGNWRPRSWLAARATLGIDFSNDNFSYLLRRGEGLFPEGSRLEQDGDIGLYTADVGVSASYVLGAEVTARTAVGAQYNRRGINTTGVAAFNLPPGSQSVAGAAVIQGFESTVESVVAGTYAEQTVAYRERVFLTTGLRVDGASSFGSGFSTAVYPKASISWLALAPTADRRPLNLGTLRLRAAYGSSGVQPGPIDALARDTLFTSLLNGTTATGAAVAALGNSDLRPERQTEFEAGVDLETAGGRVRIEATVYNRQSTDALVAQPFAPSFGIGDRASQQINVGEVRNRGIEGLINVRVLDGAALTWDVGLNGSVNQNRLLRLAPDVPVVSSGTIRQVPGYALFGFWDRPILGFSDANGNGILERSEVTFGDTAVFLGSLVPTRQLTGSTSFGLFGDRLRIGALFDYRGGHVRWNNASANRCGPIGRNCRAVNDPTAPLDEQAAAVAITNPTGVVWTGFVEDGDFLRFRELSITYSARELARPFRARTAVLTLSARNLATFSDYSGIDPERTNAPGTDRFADQPSLPPARYFIARLTLGY